MNENKQQWKTNLFDANESKINECDVVQMQIRFEFASEMRSKKK